MDAAFIIRFHYNEGDPRFDWRFAYFRSVVLPRILAQSEQGFDIAVWCNSWHRSLFLALDQKVRTFSVRPEVDGYVRPEDRERATRYHIDFTYWRDVVGLPPYEIQMGLDSDDLIRCDYVERAFKEINRAGGVSSHVCFQPLVFNLGNLTQYDYKPQYGLGSGSPFFAIRQTDRSNYIFAYEYSHLHLPRHFGQSTTVEAGYCWFTIHGANASTMFRADSQPILNP